MAAHSRSFVPTSLSYSGSPATDPPAEQRVAPDDLKIGKTALKRVGAEDSAGAGHLEHRTDRTASRGHRVKGSSGEVTGLALIAMQFPQREFPGRGDPGGGGAQSAGHRPILEHRATNRAPPRRRRPGDSRPPPHPALAPPIPTGPRPADRPGASADLGPPARARQAGSSG